MLSIGLDVHWKTTSVCILDDNGKIIKEKTILGHWDKALAYLGAQLKQFDRAAQAVFEASCGYGVWYDALMKLKPIRRVRMAHPGRLRLIFRSKRKNDRIDAQRLAKLLYLDEVPAAYVLSVEARQWRELIEYRQGVVAKVTRAKNELCALLRTQGIVAPKGLAWLASVEMATMRDLKRTILLDELTLQTGHVKKVTKVLDGIAAKSAAVTLLRTIPGIGPRTAEAVAAYVDDPDRFGRVDSIGAYFGLVPCQDASAGTNRLGHITREGPATVRKLLTEGAWQVIRRSPRMKERFLRLCQDRQDRRKKALIGVARHLACCMLSMLQSGEEWNEAA
jgi:transposase